MTTQASTDHIEYLHATQKKRFRGPLAHNDLVNLIDSRDLLSNEEWTENDYRAIANLLVGHSVHIRHTNGPPQSNKVERFFTKLSEKCEISPYLCSLLESFLVFIKSLPYQDHNGEEDGTVLLHYPTWVPPQHPQKGVPANAGNVPLAWYDPSDLECILEQSHTELLTATLTDSAISVFCPKIGQLGSLMQFQFTSPFAIIYLNREDMEESVEFMKKALTARCGSLEGFEYLTLCGAHSIQHAGIGGEWVLSTV